jgi:hypothetical protein
MFLLIFLVNLRYFITDLFYNLCILISFYLLLSFYYSLLFLLQLSIFTGFINYHRFHIRNSKNRFISMSSIHILFSFWSNETIKIYY